MKKEKKKPPDVVLLRKKAEEQLKKNKYSIKAEHLTEVDTLKLLQELEIHQVELEMQNEELRLARDQAEEATEKFTTLYDFAPTGYFTLNSDGTISELNLSGAKLLGKDRKSLVNSNIKLFITSDTHTTFNIFLQKIFTTSIKQTCEVELTAKGDSSIFAHLEGVASEEEQRCFITAIDITDRKHSERELADSVAQWQATFDAVNDGICLLSKDQRILRSNKAMRDMFQKSEDEIIGETCWEVVHGANEPIIECPVNKMERSLKRESVDIYLNDRWFNIIVDPLFNAKKKLSGIVHIVRDITEHKLAEERLRDKDKRFRALIENSADTISLLDANGLIIYDSPSYNRMMGYSEESRIGKSTFELIHPDDSKHILNLFAEILQTPQKAIIPPTRIKHGDGSWHWIEGVANNLLADSSVNAVVINFRDITDRKLTDEALQESEFFFKESQRAANIGSFKANFVTGYWESSEVLDLIFGIDNSYIRSIQGWLDIVHPEDRGMIDNYLSEEVISKHSPFNKEYRINRISDGKIRWVMGLGKVGFDAEGNVISLIGTIQDITERKHFEENLERLNHQLNELNSTKDKLFSIIAHDLKSPFHSILGFIELLSEKIKRFDFEKSAEYIDQINSAAKHILILLENLLAWAKTQIGQIVFKPESLRLQPIIQEIVEIFASATAIKNISINSFQSDDIIVYADSNMLKTILRNLISNAIKFTNPEGCISIYAESTQNQVEITVEDNGVGMNEETRNNLFNMDTVISTYGTAREKGSGLGLMLCKDLVEKHGGKIWVISEIDKGSEFHFTMPMNLDNGEGV